MRRRMIKRAQPVENNVEPVTLKTLAECVGLAAGTVSSILNQTPQSLAIPRTTRDRVFAAARKLRYQPNPFARALRTRQMPDGKATPAAGSRVLVFEGAEQFLRAVDAMRQAGLSVPGDVVVAGADDVSAMS
jgi:DNA-binding LacI/PurR family transcriptional regulator